MQGDVDGGLHIVAGHRLFALQIVLLDDGALLGDHVQTAAVDAVEIFLKGFLKAGLTDVGVHGVALILVFGPVVVIHAAHVAQNVGGVGGVVFPDGGGFHHQAGGVQLQDGGKILTGYVLDENVVGQIGHAAQVKFVAQADDAPGLLVRPFLRQLIALPHALNEQRGGDVGVQTPAVHKVLIIPLPGGIEAVQGVFKGAGGADGEVIVVADTQLLAFFQQIVQVLVAVVRGFDHVMVEYQVIAGPVAHQHIAVAVQDIASGGADGGDGGVGGCVVGVALGFNDLKGKELRCVKKHDKAKNAQQHIRSKTGHSFHV